MCCLLIDVDNINSISTLIFDHDEQMILKNESLENQKNKSTILQLLNKDVNVVFTLLDLLTKYEVKKL